MCCYLSLLLLMLKIELELNSDFKNKAEWTLCLFMNSNLNKQAQVPEVTSSRRTKSYHSQTCFNKILRIYLNEKLNFYHHIIEINAKTWAYELNSNFKNKSQWTICQYMNSDLKKQARALEVNFQGKQNHNSQTCFNNILRIYLNEKLNFYHHIIERNAQMHIRPENLFY